MRGRRKREGEWGEVTINDRVLPMMIRLSYSHIYHEENPPGIPRY